MRLAVLTVSAVLATVSPPAQAETPPDVVVLCEPTLCPAIRAAAELWSASSRAPVRLFPLPTALMAARLIHGARADFVAGLDPAALDRAQAEGMLVPDSRISLGRDALTLVHAARTPGAPAMDRIGLADQGLPGPGEVSRTWLAGLGMSAAQEIGSENTSVVAQGVADGQARTGVVFATDLKADSRLAPAPAPANAPAPPSIPAELATSTWARSPQAAGFRAFVLGPRGVEALRAAGLETAP